MNMSTVPTQRRSSSSAAASPALDRLSPDQARHHRRRAARARQAHVRHDVACRRTRRPDARDAQRDADEPLRHRALCVARGGDRACHRLEAMRQPQRGKTPERLQAHAAADGAREELRHRVRVHLARRGRRASRRSCAPTTCPAPCGFPATARPIPPTSRSRWPRARACAARDLRRRARSPPCTLVNGRVAGVRLVERRRQRRDRLRHARQLRRPVGARVRPRSPASTCRSTRPSTSTSSPTADRRRHAGPAGDPRSGRLHLLQGGSRRPGDGRLRAGGQAVERRRRFRTASSSSCCPRTGTSSRS